MQNNRGTVTEQVLPHIGIVTPTYNRNQLLKRFLKQVQRQKYTHWQLAVVNDGNNPETQELVERIARDDNRITYLHTQERTNDYGVTPRIKAAEWFVEQATVDYLVFWDDDAYFFPTALSQIITTIAEKGYPSLILMPFRYGHILPMKNVSVEQLQAGQIDMGNIVVRTLLAVECYRRIRERTQEGIIIKAQDYYFFDELRKNLPVSDIHVEQGQPIGIYNGLKLLYAIRSFVRIPRLNFAKYGWYQFLKRILPETIM